MNLTTNPHNKEPLSPRALGLYSEAEAADLLGVRVSTLRAWRARGSGPAWTALGRRIFYSESALRAHAEAQTVTPVRAES